MLFFLRTFNCLFAACIVIVQLHFSLFHFHVAFLSIFFSIAGAVPAYCGDVLILARCSPHLDRRIPYKFIVPGGGEEVNPPLFTRVLEEEAILLPSGNVHSVRRSAALSTCGLGKSVARWLGALVSYFTERAKANSKNTL
jgi:hypothetical protein